MHPLTEFWPQVFALLNEPGFDQRLSVWKDQFWQRTGIPHPLETGYEARMHMFEEWVLLDLDAPETLLMSLIRQRRIPPDRLELALEMTASQQGLFVLMSPWGKTAWFRDLLSGVDFRINEQPPVAGLEPGQILQTRFFHHQDFLGASLGRLVHPRAATESIAGNVKRAHQQGRTRLEILHLMAKLAWRAGHYLRHEPEKFYDYQHPLVQDIVAGWR